MENRVTVDEWIARFRAIGLNDAAMRRWHTLFERENACRSDHRRYPGSPGG